jgi:hypothetical protein
MHNNTIYSYFRFISERLVFICKAPKYFGCFTKEFPKCYATSNCRCNKLWGHFAPRIQLLKFIDSLIVLNKVILMYRLQYYYGVTS